MHGMRITSGVDCVLALCIVAALIASVFMCATDAKRRGKSPWLVALMVILFFPVGSLVWLAMRPKLAKADEGGRKSGDERPR